MKKNVFKIIALIICISTIACLFAGCNSESTDGKKETTTEAPEEPTPKNLITIGLSTSLSGDCAGYGESIKNAAQMAIDEINAEKNGEDALILKLVALDDKNDPNAIESVYADMKKQGVQVSLGATSSATCLKFAELSKADNMFFLTPSASADEVVKYDNAYQMCISDNNKKEGTQAGKYLYPKTKVGILYQSDDSYSTRVYNDFKAYYDTTNAKNAAAAAENGATYTERSFIESSFTASNATQFTEQIEKLKDCTIIFMPIHYTHATNFMKQAVGIIDKSVVYYGGTYFDGFTAQKDFDVKSIHNSIQCISASANNSRISEFLDKYYDTYGANAFTEAAGNAYDAIYAIYNAMNEAVKSGAKIDADTTASDLCEALKTQFNGDFEYTRKEPEDISLGANENISWESSGILTGKHLRNFNTIKNEKFLVPEIMEKEFYYEHVVEVAEAAGATDRELLWLTSIPRTIALYKPADGKEPSDNLKKMNEEKLKAYPQLQRIKEDGTVENVTLLVNDGRITTAEFRALEDLIIKYCPNITFEFLENYYKQINYTPKA